jgi:hypothetical protein
MRFLSLLVILVIVAVVSLDGSQAKAFSKHPGSYNKMEVGSENSRTDLFQEIKTFWAKLTAPLYKDRKDICVWKICSRPLKKTNDIPKKNPMEELRKLNAAKLKAIAKILYSRT